MELKELSDLIAIRNFAYQAIDNLAVKLSPEDVRALQRKVPIFDQKIIKEILSLKINIEK